MVITTQDTQLKPGYKQTEVGMIPEDWEAKKLSEITEIVMGQSPLGTSYNRYGNGFPLINGPTEFTDKYPIKIQWTNQPTKFCKKNDILLCVRGSSTGRINIANDDYCIGRGIAAIRAKNEVNAQYITFQVDCAVINILTLTTGSTFPNIDGKSLRSIKVPCPPLPEQQAIATALSDVDSLLASLDQLITKKRDIKQATMQQLLTGKTRLPGLSEGLKFGYKQTEMGMTPFEWNQYKFVQIATVRKEKVNPRRIGEYSFCIELEHISQGSGQLIGYATITEESSLKARFSIGDVLFGRLRAYLRKYWLADRNGVCSTEIWPLVPFNNVVTSQYLFQLVQTNQFIKAASAAYGTHMPRTDWDFIKNYEVSLPSLIEQQAIATVLSDMDTEIAALEQRRDKTRALKQGMMQELLTGKTRLL